MSRDLGAVTVGDMLDIIQNARVKADVVTPYAQIIVDSRHDPSFDWRPINEAIIGRWSMSALYDIKRDAWKLVAKYDEVTP